MHVDLSRARRRRNRGFMLVAALAILFVLFTLILALHWMGMSAHATYMLSEAQVQAEQGVQAQIAIKGSELQQTDGPPSAPSLEVSVSAAGDSREDVAPKEYGSEIFGAPGKKADGFNRHAGYYDAALSTALGDYKSAPWHSLLGWKPKTWRADLNVLGNRRYVVSYSGDFPCAAYAPEGQISVKQAAAWMNPLLGDDAATDPTTALSGVPVTLGARDDVTVSELFPNGEVWSEKGEVKLPKGAGGVAFYGTMPLKPGGAEVYAARIISQVETAMEALTSAAVSGNKTAAVTTGIDLGDVIDILFGSTATMRNVLSLRNAMKFPLPIIPGYTNQAIHHQLIFHMPYAPDFAPSGGGNLSLSAPKPVSETDPLQPSGRLILEEGASVVVAGNFTCQGSPRFGSVVVTGPLKRVNPITSSILSGGQVTVPYGIYSGVALDELASQALGSATLQKAFTSLVPNVAKLAGPFHRRKPYLASYATIIGILMPVPFVGVVVFPEPTATQNFNVPVFRMMSMVYSGTMNATFGENLFTHADWWVFGDGVAPVVPKVDPAAVKAIVKSLSDAFPQLAANVATLLANHIASMVTDLITTMIKKVAEQVITQLVNAVPFGSIVSSGLNAAMDEVAKTLSDKVKSATAEALGAVGGVDESKSKDVEAEIVGSLKDYVRNALDKNVMAVLAHECTGVLVYGKTGVSVGAGGAPLAVGMFVSSGNVNVQTDYVVGSLLSAHGHITANRVLYYPYYTRASLTVPKEAPASGWLEKAVEQPLYGADMYDGNSTPGGVDVGLPVQHVTAGGWDL